MFTKILIITIATLFLGTTVTEAQSFTAADPTQDTAIDAWRIESAATKDELGLLTSGYTFGFRAALLGTEAVILPIAQRIGWNASYLVYAVLICIGITACFRCGFSSG